MRIAKIINNSSAEVEGHFADIIYVQGCPRDCCCYCFNPELRPIETGKEMGTEEIISKLSALSDVVVITGGEPLYQFEAVKELIEKIEGKKIVLETSFIDTKYLEIYEKCDKVLITFKTFAIPSEIFILDNFIPCVVIGHHCFDWNGFGKILERVKNLNFRFYNDKPKDFTDVWREAKSKCVKLTKFTKIKL